MASSGGGRRFGVRVCRFVFVCCPSVRMGVGLMGGCWYIFRRFAVFSALARLYVFVEIFKPGSGVEIGVKLLVLGLELFDDVKQSGISWASNI